MALSLISPLSPGLRSSLDWKLNLRYTNPYSQFGEGECNRVAHAPTSELGRDGLGQMCAFSSGMQEE